MGDKRFLATYFNGDNYSFDWLETEEEVKDWLDENKNDYKEIEIIELDVKRVLFQDEKYCAD